jgi:PAS domain S-box-containing protein
MIASACLTLAALHLMVWWRRRERRAQALFFLAALGTAILAVLELWSMRAATPGEYGIVLRWANVPYWVLVISLVGFIRLYLRAGRPWLGWTVCGLRTLSLVLNFIFTPNTQYREITALRHVRFLGESVSVAEGVTNAWVLVAQTSLLLFVIFAVDAMLTVWRRGDRRSVMVLLGTIVFLVTANMVQSVLTFWGIAYIPVTPSVFFLGIVAVMAYEMSREVSRAADLSDSFRQNAEWLDLAADFADVGLWLWDLKTNLLWVTEKTRMLYGFSSHGQIPFEDFLSRLHPDDLDWVVQASQKCLHEGADFRYDYRIVMPDGSIRWFRVLAKAYLEPSDKPVRMTGVSLDITEHKQTELEIQQQRNELARIARVSTMGELAASVAHELNQPLGAILRNAEAAELFLQAPLPDLEEVRAILADILKDDQRAGAVLDRIRSLMKRREVQRSLLDLSLLAGEVIALVRPEAESRKVRLALDPVSSLPPVRGDRVQLQQVLLNLLLNAMDAVNGSATDSHRIATVRVQAAGTQVEVAVSDTGHGIPADKLAHVFEPFFSSKPNGLGMGLTISRSIIAAHGGRLWAENNEAGGATFTFTLTAANDLGGEGRRSKEEVVR